MIFMSNQLPLWYGWLVMADLGKTTTSLKVLNLNVKSPTQATPMGQGLVARMAFIGMWIGSVDNVTLVLRSPA